MSIALLEAMALGIPLVASAIPGNRRLIDDVKHGRLVPPDDPAALARAILDQWADLRPRRPDGPRRAAAGRRTSSRSRPSRGRHLELFRTLIASGSA